MNTAVRNAHVPLESLANRSRDIRVSATVPCFRNDDEVSNDVEYAADSVGRLQSGKAGAPASDSPCKRHHSIGNGELYSGIVDARVPR